MIYRIAKILCGVAMLLAGVPFLFNKRWRVQAVARYRETVKILDIEFAEIARQHRKD